jgi:hypothetical protein
VETFGFYKKLFFQWCAVLVSRQRIHQDLIVHVVAE